MELKLMTIFRNLELNTVENIPVIDPLKAISLTESSPITEFIILIETDRFKIDVKTLKSGQGINTAMINELAFLKLSLDQQNTVKKAVKDTGLKLSLARGPEIFGGGGMYGYAIILTKV